MSTSIKAAVNIVQGRYGGSAIEKIADLLKIGILIAYAQDVERQGPKQELHSDFWTGLNPPEIQAVFESGAYNFTDQFDGENVSIREFVIEFDQPMMAAMLTEMENENTRELPSRAGAPRQIDWDQVWTIIVVLVHEDGVDENQDKFIKDIQIRLQNNFELDIGRTTLQAKIRPLWRVLKEKASPKDVFTKPPRKAARRAKKSIQNQSDKKRR